MLALERQQKRHGAYGISKTVRCCTFSSWPNSHTEQVTLGGMVLPYVGMCHSEGYGFQEV